MTEEQKHSTPLCADDGALLPNCWVKLCVSLWEVGGVSGPSLKLFPPKTSETSSTCRRGVFEAPQKEDVGCGRGFKPSLHSVLRVCVCVCPFTGSLFTIDRASQR